MIKKKAADVGSGNIGYLTPSSKHIKEPGTYRLSKVRKYCFSIVTQDAMATVSLTVR